MTSIPAPCRRTRGRVPSFLALCALVTTTLWSSSAFAVDFRLCNSTKSRVGVAIGYKDGASWVTEGWWNVAAASCETLLTGPLVARYYYVYAIDYDRGGEWGGSAYMCTREKEFTILGIENCLARNFNRTGFFEIDTGEQRSWTVQLTDQDAGTNAGEQTQARRGTAAGRSAAAE